jgi:hypothetical protein
VPVRRTTFVDGKATSISEIKDLRRAAIPASVRGGASRSDRQEMGGRR